ncbi:MAG: transglutaminase domain-containing protein [Muribaculaceae bacterium]|nr:transglutaminase domain-containing protein [Muribaculaceae bacterium]
MTTKHLPKFAAIVMMATALNAMAVGPDWLETDSAAAIAARTARDFPYSVEEAAAMIRTELPDVTDEQINTFINRKYLETCIIDGKRRVFRKGVRNLMLLNPDLNGGVRSRGATASPARISYVDSVLNHCRGTNPAGGAHKVRYRFSIEVPWHEALDGDTLRVWMPLPHESARQHHVKILNSYPRNYIGSDSSLSVHNTIYFEQPVRSGQTTRFEYEGEFVTCGQYFSPSYILANIRPYDTQSELYRRYTAVEAPHMPRLDSLAREITGSEKNPYLCSELVYDYIINHYLWAGAREYSTIDCIPEYVINEGHGDCGQVSLLYISLMRTLGIPARWESGWMLHPGEKNYHDWAEVYFEGVGWVPVDVSFGRYSNSSDAEIRNFYSTGMDAHRFASNRGICGELYPAKRFVRSETVDFQPGEVECSKGNLFYPAWNQSLELIEITPVE